MGEIFTKLADLNQNRTNANKVGQDSSKCGWSWDEIKRSFYRNRTFSCSKICEAEVKKEKPKSECKKPKLTEERLH